MKKFDERISDSELLTLTAQGNLDAKKMLNDRYFYYCKNITKEFLENHRDYGFTYEDFFNAAMLGYCRARNKFEFEKSDGFYPYFKIWAESEMKALVEEGNKFYLNENPKKFVSFDITYMDDDDSLCLSETCGLEDDKIFTSISGNELTDLLTNSKFNLTEIEMKVCICLILKLSDKEIRSKLDLNYNKYYQCIKSIRRKIGKCLHNIIK